MVIFYFGSYTWEERKKTKSLQLTWLWQNSVSLWLSLHNVIVKVKENEVLPLFNHLGFWVRTLQAHPRMIGIKIKRMTSSTLMSAIAFRESNLWKVLDWLAIVKYILWLFMEHVRRKYLSLVYIKSAFWCFYSMHCQPLTKIHA